MKMLIKKVIFLNHMTKILFSHPLDVPKMNGNLRSLATFAVIILRETVRKQCKCDGPLAGQFVSDCGVTQCIKDLDKPDPFDIFSVLLTDDIVNHLVFNTNCLHRNI